MVTVKVYDSTVNCDRQHLLKVSEIPEIETICYTETGDSFNGWNSVILDCGIDIVIDSRVAALNINGLNHGNDIYYLIKDIVPIRNDKTMLNLEYDAWMNCRNYLRFGEQNYLYQISALQTKYPYSDIIPKEYHFEKQTNLFSTYLHSWNIFILYHNSETNEDRLYWIDSEKYAFPFYHQNIWYELDQIGVDSNNIISVWLSPFPLWGGDLWTNEYSIQQYAIRSANFNNVIFKIQNDASWKFYDVYPIYSTPVQKTVITDALGAIVWTAPNNFFGNVGITVYPDISYSGFNWSGFVGTDTIENRFTIQSIDLGYIVDYYQEYQNLQKGYNSEIRQAQLEKQLIQNLGNMVTSGINTGVMGSLGGMGGMGAAAGTIGGAVNAAVDYAATSKYNNKLEKIEQEQAKMQYDGISTNVMSFQNFINERTYPALYLRKPDDMTINSITGLHNDLCRFTYNCRIQATDLNYYINQLMPMYISGDFDFLGISEANALQLNSRFKAGVNFVNWSGDLY